MIRICDWKEGSPYPMALLETFYGRVLSAGYITKRAVSARFRRIARRSLGKNVPDKHGYRHRRLSIRVACRNRLTDVCGACPCGERAVFLSLTSPSGDGARAVWRVWMFGPGSSIFICAWIWIFGRLCSPKTPERAKTKSEWQMKNQIPNNQTSKRWVAGGIVSSCIQNIIMWGTMVSC